MFNEEAVENAIIEQLQGLGYDYKYAPDIERDYKEVILKDEFYESLYRINKDGSEENVQLSCSEENTKTTLLTIFGTSKEIHNYKLEIEYDKDNNITLDKNITLSIILASEQIIPK